MSVDDSIWNFFRQLYYNYALNQQTRPSIERAQRRGMETAQTSNVVLESGDDHGGGEYYIGVPLKIRRLDSIGNRYDWVGVYKLDETDTDMRNSRITWDWLVNGQCQLNIVQTSSGIASASSRGRQGISDGTTEDMNNSGFGCLSPATKVIIMMYSGGSWITNGNLIYRRVVEIKNPLQFVVVEEPSDNGIAVSFKFICKEAFPENGVIFSLDTTDGIRISKHNIVNNPSEPTIMGSIIIPIPRCGCNVQVKCLLVNKSSEAVLYRSQSIHLPDPHPWRCCLLAKCSFAFPDSNYISSDNHRNSLQSTQEIGGSRFLVLAPNEPFTIRVPGREGQESNHEGEIAHSSDTIFIIPFSSHDSNDSISSSPNVSRTTQDSSNNSNNNSYNNIDLPLSPFKFNSKVRGSVDKHLVSSLEYKTFQKEAGVYHVYLGLMHKECFLPSCHSILIVTGLFNVDLMSNYNNNEGNQPRVPICSICLDNIVSIMIEPCNHLCVCEGCKEHIMLPHQAICPICRGPIKKTSKVFF
eukprot:Tbor_TRINITY_DN5060_c0_g1::TRINITY_DN5060_c0_g1_i1::g.14423::m.14423